MSQPTSGSTGRPPHYGYPVPSGSGSPSPTEAAASGVALSDEAAHVGRGPRRAGLIVGGLTAALVLGGAGVFAATQLGGGGPQPADVLPGDAYAYVRLDIDPSAGQKIAAVRFLGSLPQVRSTLGSDDPRRQLWELATQDSTDDCVAKVDYDTDIAPWLGDRVGAAVRPGGTADEPNVALAIQVSDEDAARSTLTRLLACGSGPTDTDVRMKDGFAILTPAGLGDATLAATTKGTLAQNATFSQDMTALGEQGVASAWFDLGRGFTELEKLGADRGLPATATSSATGRVASALRFDADYVELAGVVRGVDAATAVAGDGTEVANLPANTMAALHVAGAGRMVENAWPDLERQVDALSHAEGGPDVIGEIERELDVTLPDDLSVLLGRSLTLSLPGQDVTGDVPLLGAKVVSDDAKRADALLGRLSDLAFGAGGALTHRVDGDKVYLATTADYADDLRSGGRLGDSEAFTKAVGDVGSSNVVLFLDLDKMEKVIADAADGEMQTFLESLQAFGVNASSTGDGSATFTVRLVGN
jgi:hypothetical protein